MENKEIDIIVISDHIGRLVAGELVGETDETLTMKNPVIIHVEPNAQTAQLQVHTLPYIFMEFAREDTRETNNNWIFNKSSVAVSDVVLDEKLKMSVLNINKPKVEPVADTAGDPKVVSLFDN